MGILYGELRSFSQTLTWPDHPESLSLRGYEEIGPARDQKLRLRLIEAVVAPRHPKTVQTLKLYDTHSETGPSPLAAASILKIPIPRMSKERVERI